MTERMIGAEGIALRGFGGKSDVCATPCFMVASDCLVSSYVLWYHVPGSNTLLTDPHCINATDHGWTDAAYPSHVFVFLGTCVCSLPHP